MKTSRVYSSRMVWRFLLPLMLLAVNFRPAFATDVSAPAKTVISDTVYRADGTPAKGTVLVTWPAFTSSDNHAIAAGLESATIGEFGNLNLSLVPNEGAIPAGTFYKVVLKLDDGTTSTEYWVVPATSPVTIAAVRVKLSASNSTTANRFSAPDPVSPTDVANKRYVDSVAAAGSELTYADRFSGTTPEDKISAAANSLAGGFGPVWVPSTLGGGYSTVMLPASKALIFDWRGCFYNVYANGPVCGSNGRGAYLQQRIAEPATAPNLDTYQTFQIHQTAETGGINQASPTLQKSNFDPFEVSLLRYTPGQSQGITSQNFCGTDGDCFGVTSMTTQWGRTNAAGDEGMKAVVGNAYQGSEEFTATVASVSGNTIDYSSPQYEYSRGERRYLIVTNRAVYSTGTISGISNYTVTGSGTTWTTLCPGGTAPCDPGNLFFELNAGNAASSQHYVVKVRQVLSATSLTLDARDMNTTGDGYYYWQGDATTGAYKLYKGSIVTRVYASGGKVDVADGTQLQANDAVLMPLGNSLGITAGDFKVKRFVPGGTANAIVNMENIGPRSVPYGLLFYGKIGNSIYFEHDPSYTPGADIRSDYGTGLANYNSVPDNTNFQILCMNRNAAVGGQFCMRYNMQYDQLNVTGFGDMIIRSSNTSGELFNVQNGNSVSVFTVRSDSIYHNNGSFDFWQTSGGAETARISGATGEGKFAKVTSTASINSDGGGLKHKRVSTGSVGANSSLDVTVNWTTAFADANYTVTCDVVEATGTLTKTIKSVAAASVLVHVKNTSAGSLTGTLNCIAMHD